MGEVITARRLAAKAPDGPASHGHPPFGLVRATTNPLPGAYPSAARSATISPRGPVDERVKCVSDHPIAPGEHSTANYNDRPSGSSDGAQVWILSLQMQALALAIEDLRARLTRIEQHLKLDRNDEEKVRFELSKLDEIWR
jgi:hypothetical protein